MSYLLLIAEPVNQRAERSESEGRVLYDRMSEFAAGLKERGLLIAGKQPVWTLVAVASVGNVVGSTINWALGRSIERLRERRWFPIKGRALERAENWYRRFGRWTLLLSWTPVIGDPLTMIAGVLREPLWSFLLIVAIAKTARYAVIAAMLTM